MCVCIWYVKKATRHDTTAMASAAKRHKGGETHAFIDQALARPKPSEYRALLAEARKPYEAWYARVGVVYALLKSEPNFPEWVSDVQLVDWRDAVEIITLQGPDFTKHTTAKAECVLKSFIVSTDYKVVNTVLRDCKGIFDNQKGPTLTWWPEPDGYRDWCDSLLRPHPEDKDWRRVFFEVGDWALAAYYDMFVAKLKADAFRLIGNGVHPHAESSWLMDFGTAIYKNRTLLATQAKYLLRRSRHLKWTNLLPWVDLDLGLDRRDVESASDYLWKPLLPAFHDPTVNCEDDWAQNVARLDMQEEWGQIMADPTKKRWFVGDDEGVTKENRKAWRKIAELTSFNFTVRHSQPFKARLQLLEGGLRMLFGENFATELTHEEQDGWLADFNRYGAYKTPEDMFEFQYLAPQHSLVMDWRGTFGRDSTLQLSFPTFWWPYMLYYLDQVKRIYGKTCSKYLVEATFVPLCDHYPTHRQPDLAIAAEWKALMRNHIKDW